jgi:enoyl-CoA hydratase/carnithine racemase
MTSTILCDVKDHIATVTLNRPEKRNALNSEALHALAATLTQLEYRQDVRVVVIRGAGKTFCAGRDLPELSQHQDSGERGLVDVVEIFHQIETSRHPTIAMVHGEAVAGGCELALHCDLRVVADTARFSMPLARLGRVIPFDLAGKLVEIIGPAYTRQMLLTAQPVHGQRAFEIGMAHQVVSAAELEPATYALARTIAANAPLALAGMKAMIRRALSLREHIAHADLDEMVERVRQSADMREGVQAMLEKRHPVFRGE